MSTAAPDFNRIRRARRLCFFAHYDQDGIVADHVLHYLDAIARSGFEIVVVSTAGLDGVQAARLNDRGHHLLLRENEGLDFGGWIEMCIRTFPIDAELLLLANDSVYAPVGDLGEFIDRLLAVDADFYGAVESAEIRRHLQSWFLLLRPTAFNSLAFRGLMTTPMPAMESKAALIERYEIGLTQSLATSGLRHHAAFSPLVPGRLAADWPYNPAHLLWSDLLAAGVPFIKIEMLRFNLIGVGDLDEWQRQVEARAPALLPMIESDLRRRGTRLRPGYFEMSKAAPVYWPELRTLVLADHRGTSATMRRLRRFAFRTMLAAIWYPRRAYAKLALRRHRGSSDVRR